MSATDATSGAGQNWSIGSQPVPHASKTHMHATAGVVGAASLGPLKAAAPAPTSAVKAPTGAPIQDCGTILKEQYPVALARYCFKRDSSGELILDPKKLSVCGQDKYDLVAGLYTPERVAFYVILAEQFNLSAPPTLDDLISQVDTKLNALKETQKAKYEQLKAQVTQKAYEWADKVADPTSKEKKEYDTCLRGLLEHHDGPNFHLLSDASQKYFKNSAKKNNPFDADSGSDGDKLKAALRATDMFQYMDQEAQRAFTPPQHPSPQRLSMHKVSHLHTIK